jgi:hypothetical protein
VIQLLTQINEYCNAKELCLLLLTPVQVDGYDHNIAAFFSTIMSGFAARDESNERKGDMIVSVLKFLKKIKQTDLDEYNNLLSSGILLEMISFFPLEGICQRRNVSKLFAGLVELDVNFTDIIAEITRAKSVCELIKENPEKSAEFSVLGAHVRSLIHIIPWLVNSTQDKASATSAVQRLSENLDEREKNVLVSAQTWCKSTKFNYDGVKLKI